MRSLSNYVGGCSVFDQANYSTRGCCLQVQGKGLMELEWKRSDVLPEFWSGKNSQTISGHAFANQLAPRKCLKLAFPMFHT